jgi:cytoskeletal protein RodZ
VAGNPYTQYDNLYKQYQTALKERDELAKQLARLKENKEFLQKKSSALASSKDDKSQNQQKAKQGYQLLHILLVAIISLIIGALVKQ